MKIGIISMQRVKNNGSFLQAYALQKELERYGHDVEFIDFDDEMHKETERVEDSFIKKICKKGKALLIPTYRKNLEVAACRQEFDKRYTSFLSHIGLSKDYNYHNGKKFNLVVIGSDEVFNICQYSDKRCSIPWELLGEGIKTERLITYAASCGQTSVASVGKIRETEHCKELLNKFSAISVRDKNSNDFVQEMTGKAPLLHIDPVLLAEKFPADPQYKKLKYKYLLVYAYTMRMNNAEEQKAVQEYAKTHGLKIVCVNCYQPWCDVKITVSPFALLQYIKDADCVVTDTFHGTVFSIRNNTRFVTIVRDSNRNKLRSLLGQFGLAERELTEINRLQEIMNQPINFNEVNEKLQEERERSKEYLKEYV